MINVKDKTILEDKAIRHQLIERYLDADTSVEEERAMADFYRHCDKSKLTDEDLDIRNIMLGLNIAAQTQKPEKPTHQGKSKFVRFSAIMLAAAMLAGLIFLVFPIKDRMTQKPNFAALAPTTQVIRSQQTQDSNDNLSPAEQMERQDSLFLAATKDIVTPMNRGNVSSQKKIENVSPRKASSIHPLDKLTFPKHSSEADKQAHSSEAENEVAGDDFHQLYEVASLALPSADQLKIDKQGNHIVISTVDEHGNSQHYTVDVDDAQEGIYQLHPLAQLN